MDQELSLPWSSPFTCTEIVASFLCSKQSRKVGVPERILVSLVDLRDQARMYHIYPRWVHWFDC